MTIVVNGHPQTVADDLDVATLVRALGQDPDRPGTAVACNGDVVPRRDWPATRLAEGDAVEVVRAVGGG